MDRGQDRAPDRNGATGHRSGAALPPEPDHGMRLPPTHLVRKAIEDFTVNKARMDYPAYAASGLPLGSGIVESSCRLVSGLRVKQPGMRWSLSGVQAILSLRALHLSQTSAWDAFWRRKPLLRRPRIATLTRTPGRCA